MSIQLQILIPLAITLAALVAIAVVRRCFRWEMVVIGVVMAAVAVLAFRIPSEEADAQGDQVAEEDYSVTLAIACRTMLDGDYAEAEELLDALSQRTVSEELLLARARCALLQGNDQLASQLYASLEDPAGDEAEAAALLAESAVTGSDALIRYLTDLGEDPSEYGLSAGETTTVDREETIALIRELLEETIDDYGQRVGSASESARALNREFSNFTSGYLADQEIVSASLKSLEDAMGRASFQANRELRAARTKGYIMVGDYAAIADSADRYVSPEELIILAELYTQGQVTEKDFRESYTQTHSGELEDVIDACLDALDASEDEISEDDYTAYRLKIEELEEQLESPALWAMRTDLLTEAESGEEALRSQCYLALSKLESFLGNEDQSDAYLQDALASASASGNEGYRTPMTSMAAVVQGTADSAEVKNVDVYVDEALANALPYGLTSDRLLWNRDAVTGDAEASAAVYVVTQALDDNTDEDASLRTSFRDRMINTVSQGSALLNIGVINPEEFPQVSARVQIQSSRFSRDELAEHLIVYDCGNSIEDYELKELTFQRSRIILLCDVSGSMSGSVDSLKNAIEAFANDMGEGEEVSVVGFSSGIEFVEPFSSDPGTVAGYADRIYASGGTALYQSLLYCGDLLTYDVNVNNIIIAMTDGQDGNSPSDSDMRERIGAMAAEKGITVYTMGLGSSVDTDYLEKIASYGNGSFLYVRGDEELANFYSFIHNQLDNQYVLSYTAVNTTKNRRVLELELEGELGGAEKEYYLTAPDSYLDSGVEVDTVGRSVYGFSTKFLYKSSKAQTIRLRGKGFAEDDEITVRITGSVRYELEAAYVDENSYSVTIPSEISVGTYDLEVSVGGDSFKIEDELTVAVSEGEKNFRFGDYNFTALSSSVDSSGRTVLSGNVALNDWLFFKGDVVFESGYESAGRLLVTDESGAYISYSENTAMGLAKTMAKYSLGVDFGPLGSFFIYSDPYKPGEYTDFPVDRISYSCTLPLRLLAVETSTVSIYPDMASVQAANLHWQLPFQDQLVSNLKLGENMKFNLDTDMLFGATSIGFKADIDYSTDKGKEFNFVSVPMKLAGIKVKADTLSNDYSLEGKVKFKAIAGGMDSLSMNFEVKDGKFDGIGLTTGGTRVTLVSKPVPVSMRDFGLELSGFSKYESDESTLSNVLGTTVKVKFGVDAASLNAYLPEIAKVINDKEEVALASLDDCELSMTLKEFKMDFEADVKLLTVLDLGSCEVSLGCFDYTNKLIGFVDEDQYGLSVKATVGSPWDTANLHVDIEGSGEATLGYPFSGITIGGKASFDVGWWLLHAELELQGNVLFGVYKNTSGDLQFSAIVRGTRNSGEYAGVHVFVTRATGLDMYLF